MPSASLLSGVFGFRSVLLNPCVHPQDYFQNLIGDHVNTVTGERFALKPQMLDTLKALDASIAFSINFSYSILASPFYF